MEIRAEVLKKAASNKQQTSKRGGRGIHPFAAWVMAAWKSKILLSALNGNMTTRQSRARKARKGSWVMARSVAAADFEQPTPETRAGREWSGSNICEY